jgi:uncharacterized protein YprB with RNaseH-like and TPR domain
VSHGTSSGLLERTFIHIDGIGRKTERRLWERGIFTWKDFLECGEGVFSPGRDASIRAELKKSLAHRDDPGWFYERLSSGETWRLFGDFGDFACYLDIETAGLEFGTDEITVIGLFGKGRSQSFVNGFNMDSFEKAVAEYELIVTFNGQAFDLPFIRRAFPHVYLPKAHIDLRFVLRKLGLTGGLKKIEQKAGIARRASIEGMNGLDAVYLWQKWQDGDREALDLLVEYNRADAENLKPLMEMAFNKLKRIEIQPDAP